MSAMRGTRQFRWGQKSFGGMLVLQFLLLPLFHFHPAYSHDHAGDSERHSHSGYIHSYELMTFAEAMDWLLPDVGMDENKTHNHSAPEQEADADAYDTYKAAPPAPDKFSNAQPTAITAAWPAVANIPPPTADQQSASNPLPNEGPSERSPPL